MTKKWIINGLVIGSVSWLFGWIVFGWFNGFAVGAINGLIVLIGGMMLNEF